MIRVLIYIIYHLVWIHSVMLEVVMLFKMVRADGQCVALEAWIVGGVGWPLRVGYIRDGL